MKAMGNRLTPHEVKEINLLPSTIEEDEEILAMDSEPNQPVDDTDTSVTSRARDIDTEMEPAMGTEVNAEEPLSETESMQHAESDEEIVGDVTEVKLAVEQDAPIVSEEPPKEEIKPANKIDFEITNTDDPDADDKGQLGLF
jgi:topoisomerase-4 subunit A